MSEKQEGCDCAELCSVGPTCPGGMLARLPGAGCWRSDEPVGPSERVQARIDNLHTIADRFDHPGGSRALARRARDKADGMQTALWILRGPPLAQVWAEGHRNCGCDRPGGTPCRNPYEVRA